MSKTQIDVKPEDFPLRHTERVRYAECDLQGIVFNANYFLYFDVGITEYFRMIGFKFEQAVERENWDFHQVNAEANFRAPLRADEPFEVCCRVSRMGNSSMDYELAIFRDGELMCDGRLVSVCCEQTNMTPIPIPESFRQMIADAQPELAKAA